MKKKYLEKSISEWSGSDKHFWENNWNNEKVEQQLSALQWSGYIPIFEKYISNDKNKIILENGCGLGSAFQYFNSKNQNIYGLDYVLKPLNILKNHTNTGKLINENGFKLPFKSNSFDYCISLGVVEHFEKEGPEPLVNEMHRILKKSGVLIISVPYYNLIERINLLFHKSDNNNVFYQYLFNSKEFKKLIIDSGFNIINYYYCNKLAFLYNSYKKIFKKSNNTSNNPAKTAKIKNNTNFNRIYFLNRIIPDFFSSSLITIVASKK